MRKNSRAEPPKNPTAEEKQKVTTLHTRAALFLVLGVGIPSLLVGCENPSEPGSQSGETEESAAALASTRGLVARLKMNQAAYKATQSEQLTFTITNNTAENQQLLKWATPLFDMDADLFRVSLNGNNARYIGPLVKRPPATPEDYFVIAPGQSMVVQIQLSEFYDIYKPGQYSVEYIGDVSGKALSKGIASSSARVSTNTTTFTLLEERQAKVTSTLTSPSSSLAATAKTTRYVYCSAEQQALLATALYDAGRITTDSYQSLVGTPEALRSTAARYAAWFGAYDWTRYQHVMADFGQIEDALLNKTIVFWCNCTKNYYAYVRADDPYSIFLCNRFWDAPATGTDSKAGTLVHETSHFNAVAGTNDQVYGQNDCRSLATTDPGSAVHVADCHEYFAENLPRLSMGLPILPTFSASVQYYPSGWNFGLPSSWDTITGDFNGDGKTDYARLGAGATDAFLSNGDGTFAAFHNGYPSGWNFGLPSNWKAITGDFNGDGKTDYARLGGTYAHVWISNGLGGFTASWPTYPNGRNYGLPTSWDVITGDFNGDGKGDFAWVGATEANIMQSNGNGTFTAITQTYPSGWNFGLPSSWKTIAGDFNGDGKTDYVRLGDTYEHRFLSNGDGTFLPSVQYYPSGWSFGLPSSWVTVTGDFNGDGKTDYARTGYSYIRTVLSGSGGSISTQAQYGAFGQPSEVITGDFNGDGRTDYATPSALGTMFYISNGDGTFGSTIDQYPDGWNFGYPSSWKAIAGDFNGDGKFDYARLGGTYVHEFMSE